MLAGTPTTAENVMISLLADGAKGNLWLLFSLGAINELRGFGFKAPIAGKRFVEGPEYPPHAVSGCNLCMLCFFPGCGETLQCNVSTGVGVKLCGLSLPSECVESIRALQTLNRCIRETFADEGSNITE